MENPKSNSNPTPNSNTNRQPYPQTNPITSIKSTCVLRCRINSALLRLYQIFFMLSLYANSYRKIIKTNGGIEIWIKIIDKIINKSCQQINYSKKFKKDNDCSDVALRIFLVSHFQKFHQKWSVILSYFSHKKNKMLSIILKNVQSMTEWLTLTTSLWLNVTMNYY